MNDINIREKRGKKTLIIKNVTHENPGLISQILNEHNLKYDIIDLSEEVNIPEIQDYGLLIIMGGPDSANDQSDKILKELNCIKLALQNEMPIFGICLGLQLMVKICGGKVYKNPIQEIGLKHKNKEWYRIKLTEEGSKDPMFKGVKDSFIVFQLHGETVTLTEEVKLLGTGKFCKNQVIKIGKKSYGFQYHFEITEDLFENLLLNAPELEGHDLYRLRKEFEMIKEDYLKRGQKVFQNYLKTIQFI